MIPSAVRLARNAMHTRFEIVLHGENPVHLRAAGEEALNEIDRLESQLSLFRPDSEIARVNARAARQPVRVTPAVFRLLQHAKQLHRETGGAFDVTVAPLLKCWGLLGETTGRVPTIEELTKARQNVGMDLVQLNESELTVHFSRPGVIIDLGAIGKGHAIDCAVEILRDAGIESGLVHGGTSSAYGIGHPPDGDAWRVGVDGPPQPTNVPRSVLSTISLRDDSLSVSAVWGKSFNADGRTLGHVIDPRTGEPTRHAVLAAVTSPNAAESDALSTALLTFGKELHDHVAGLRPGIRTLLAFQDRDTNRLSIEERGWTG